MKKTVFVSSGLLLPLLLLVLPGSLLAQTYTPAVDNYKPVTPLAYQFTKYTELPVSEYTGIPEIAIPLYEIEEDEVKVPINLTYHAAGIRVSQEASWVGLGWDLSIGSVVQTIYDNDDLKPGITKKRPDYSNDPLPQEYPLRWVYGVGTTGPEWTPTVPVIAAQQNYGAKIATDYYYPINGNLDNRDLNYFNSHNLYDGEQDIFRANFLGQSISFVINWSSGGAVVLNKKGYSVGLTSDTSWHVTDPTGTQYYFESKSYVQTTSSGAGIFGMTYSVPLPSSRTWLLTRIITKYGNKINFNYTNAGSFGCFPSYSEKWQKPTLTSEINHSANDGTGTGTYIKGFNGLQFANLSPGYLNRSTTNNIEDNVYLTSIDFPKGQVKFITSTRQDVLGGVKLDSIAVLGNQLVKSFKFTYAYFDTLASSGRGFAYSTSVFGNKATLRLKLQSVRQIDGGLYSFDYNTLPLPAKNCLAQDYWGYYNGATFDTSLIPNPVQFNRSDLWNNGDNHSANVTYAQAGILNEVVYPTGGKTDFEYELNTFNNYWVPDYATSANTISSGNGLRVKTITFKGYDNAQFTKDVYTYAVGKSILPVNIFRNYNLTTLWVTGNGNNNANCDEKRFRIDEIDAAGFMSTSPTTSVNGIGYDTVTKQQVDINGVSIGKTVTCYNNTPDYTDGAMLSYGGMSISMPSMKNTTAPENGSVKSVSDYDNAGSLVRRVEHRYTNSIGPIFYSARLFGWYNLMYWDDHTDIKSFEPIDQHMIGFYPIFDFESLSDTTISTEYFNGDSLTQKSWFTYNDNNQVETENKTLSKPDTYEQTSYQYAYEGASTLSTWMAQGNRLSDIGNYDRHEVRISTGAMSNPIYNYTKGYKVAGSLIVDSVVVYRNHPFPYDDNPPKMTYDLYDTTNGHVLQFTDKLLTKSYVWDYSGQYVIAEVNGAIYKDVAYTSFEADGAGNWTLPAGGTVTTGGAMTGTKYYTLPSGSITKTGLNASKKYVVSYWSQNGALTVSSSIATTNHAVGSWTYYEVLVSGATSVTLSGSGKKIDELRLFPAEAEMTTHTWKPLLGIESECTPTNYVTYYNYDAWGRLAFIKDLRGNVIKTMTYGYHH